MHDRNWRQIARRATYKIEHGAMTAPPPAPDGEHPLLDEACELVEDFIQSPDHRRALVYALIVHARNHPSIYR